MGLLDDAIREHLELKRRRGADPTEIDRAERDALGPVRRAPEEFEHDESVPEGAAQAADEYEYEDESAGHYVEDFAPADPQPDGDLLTPPSLEDHDTALPEARPGEPEGPMPSEIDDLGDETGAAELGQPAIYDDAAAPAQEPEPHRAPGPEHHEPADVERETAEYDVEGEPEGEDMLEETPEFLQDAPEHDRLWFEQRPPRDFDFDG